MQEFTISDIENLTGIKAHTLRIWEQRYGLCPAHRRDSNHRFYDNEHLKQLLRVCTLYRAGFKISRIAAMSEAETLLAIGKLESVRQYEDLISQLVVWGLAFDEQKFNSVLNNTILHNGLEKSILKVMFPLLNKVGTLWLTNHLIPAQEHFISNIIRDKIILGIDGLPRPSASGKTVLLFAPEKECHELPLLLLQYLLKKKGVHTAYLGNNVSIGALNDFIQGRAITHLLVNAVTYFSDGCFQDYLIRLRETFPGKKIVAAGAATEMTKDDIPGIQLLREPEEIRLFIASL